MDTVNALKDATVNIRNPYQLHTALVVVVEKRSETIARRCSRTSCQLISVMNTIETFSISASSSICLLIAATFRFQLVSLKPISPDAGR